MTLIQFGNAKDNIDFADSREVAEAIDQDHTYFFSKVILRNQEQVEKITRPLIVLTDKPVKKSKGGRPQRYALLTREQLLIFLTLTKATPKTVEAIAFVAKDLLGMKKTKTMKHVWDKINERIRPGSKVDIAFDYIHTKTHFSPEEEFCKFFHQLETSVNFSLSFDWWQYAEDMETENEEEDEEEIEYIAGDGYDERYDNYLFEALNPEDELLITDVEEFIWHKTHCKQHPHQYWVTRFDDEQSWIFKGMDHHHEKAIEFHLCGKEHFFNWRNKELDQSLRTEEMKKAKTAFIERNKHEAEIKNLKEEIKDLTSRIAYGIKPHYDFVQWWQANDELMTRKGWATYKTVYEGELEVSGEHRGAEDFEDTCYDAPDFEDGIQIIEYKSSDEEYDDSNNDPQLQHGALFKRLAVYPLECKPVFDYYLQNIWYPEHSVKFIDSVDPEGSKYLKEALPQISPTQLRMLPRGFVKFMRECLPESGKKLISAAIER